MSYSSENDQISETKTVLVSSRAVSQVYHKDSAVDLQVLDDVTLDIYEGEIVGLLGRAGSGKSSFLRIMAGLISPSSGEVVWNEKRQPEKNRPDVAMVFQSFALFPWMTVKENIALGLKGQKLSKTDKETQVTAAIELMGLGGYENAWPKELAPDMKQRVGMARALAIRPELICMDEPFSDLDILTAENLRTDFVELWNEDKLPVKSLMMVTHNIEEAVLICDRIVVFSSNPGRVAHILPVTLSHPRSREDQEFRGIVDHIYALMTQRAPVISEADISIMPKPPSAPAPSVLTLPPVSVAMMTGMMEALAASPLNGRADLPVLAEKLQLELDDLFPLGESLELLGLAELEDGDIFLTDEGVHFVLSDHEERKAIMGYALIHNVPLIKTIRAVLDERPSHSADATRFLSELEAGMSPDYARQTLHTLIGWTRFAELFDYDEESNRFYTDEKEGD